MVRRVESDAGQPLILDLEAPVYFSEGTDKESHRANNAFVRHDWTCRGPSKWTDRIRTKFGKSNG